MNAGIDQEGFFRLATTEAAAVYAALKGVEDSLPQEAESALRRIERYLYERLSIAEMEALARGKSEEWRL